MKQVYDPNHYSSRLKYPWPDCCFPQAERLAKQSNDIIIENEYAFLSEETREKYKRMRLEYVTARMVPGDIDYERIIPCHRYVLWVTIFDDYYEFCSYEEMKLIVERSGEILRGAKLRPEDHPLDYQLGKMMEEFKAFMPADWVKAYAESVYRFARYGTMEELPYKAARRYPSLPLFKAMRDESIGMRPVIFFAEVQMDYVLPREIHKNPVFQRIRVLASRLIVWQNDLLSFPKEIGRETETFNSVFVLQHILNCSIEEAAEEVLRLNNADVEELAALQTSLSDFAIYSEPVHKYVEYVCRSISGLCVWYGETERYLAENAGYPEPEYNAANNPPLFE